MKFSLVVVRAFAAHVPGDVIDGDEAVSCVLAGEHVNHVVRVERSHLTHATTREG